MSVHIKNSSNIPIRIYFYNANGRFNSDTDLESNAELTQAYTASRTNFTVACRNTNINQNDICYVNATTVGESATEYPEIPNSESYTRKFALSTVSSDYKTYYISSSSSDRFNIPSDYVRYFNIFVDSTKVTSKQFSFSGSINNGSYSYTPNDLTGASELTVTFTANTGYHFASAPTITYDSSTITATLSEDTKTATATISQSIASSVASNSGTFTVSGEAVQIGFIFKGSIANASYSYTPDDLTGASAVTVTFTADSGYHFTYAPVLISSDGEYDITSTLASNNKTATAVISQAYASAMATYNDSYLISGATEVDTANTFSFSGSINNGSYSYTPNDLTGASELTVTFTANTGYHFASAPTITYNSSTITATLSEDTKTATATISQSIASSVASNSGTFTVSGGAVLDSSSNNYTIDNRQLSNCSYTYTDSSLKIGTENIFTFTANNGYQFTTAPYIQFNENVDGSRLTITSTVSEDKLTAILTIDTSYSAQIDDVIDIYATATVITPVSKDYGFITLYNPTNDQLRELSGKRFIYASSSSTLDIVDLGNYIQSVKKFYCNIPTTLSQNIVLGKYDTEISCLIVDEDIIDFDCGEISVESTNENNNDYDNIIFILLPFIGKQSLESSVVMNKTLHLYYRISLISGNVIAYIAIDDTVVYSFEGNCSQEIPYILYGNYSFTGQLNYPNNVLYDYIPTVVILYNKNYNENNSIIVTDNQYALLSSLSGYKAVSDIVINNTNITSDEIDLIKSILRNGVWF